MVVVERDVCLQREENGGVYIGFWQFQIAGENNGRKDNKNGQKGEPIHVIQREQ